MARRLGDGPTSRGGDGSIRTKGQRDPTASRNGGASLRAHVPAAGDPASVAPATAAMRATASAAAAQRIFSHLLPPPCSLSSIPLSLSPLSVQLLPLRNFLRVWRLDLAKAKIREVILGAGRGWWWPVGTRACCRLVGWGAAAGAGRLNLGQETAGPTKTAAPQRLFSGFPGPPNQKKSIANKMTKFVGLNPTEMLGSAHMVCCCRPPLLFA